MRNPIFCVLFSITASAWAAPPLMLAEEYNNQNVQGWAASEKLDGVRAYWDGKKLISRQGYAFAPPPGFTRNFPPYPLDGELYSSRGQFERISAATRSADGDWGGIKLYVFDLPKAEGNLYQRLAVLEGRLKKYPANIVVVKQTPVKNIEEARAMMEKIVKAGGEGVILRDPQRPQQRLSETETPAGCRMYGNAPLRRQREICGQTRRGRLPQRFGRIPYRKRV